MLVLDHIFILVSPSAPEADSLIELGLQEGPSNSHPGQGTANRRFFFANTTLEFLFIDNIAEAMNGAAKDLKLVERAIDIDGSPFGLVSRWAGEEEKPGFSHFTYQPEYFPKPMHFYVGKNASRFAEPLCICMPLALEKPTISPSPNNPDWTLTNVELSVPQGVCSDVLRQFAQSDLVSIRHNQEHHMKLVFNDAKESKKHISPDIQLTIEY